MRTKYPPSKYDDAIYQLENLDGYVSEASYHIEYTLKQLLNLPIPSDELNALCKKVLPLLDDVAVASGKMARHYKYLRGKERKGKV